MFYFKIKKIYLFYQNMEFLHNKYYFFIVEITIENN